jgi:hypothetical protein
MAPHELHKVPAWTFERLCYELEKYNGWGYRQFGIPSPYLYAKTSQAVPGKYVADGRFDPQAVDAQCGGLAVLKALMASDPTITFNASSSAPKAPEAPVPPKPPTFLQRLLTGIGVIVSHILGGPK